MAQQLTELVEQFCNYRLKQRGKSDLALANPSFTLPGRPETPTHFSGCRPLSKKERPLPLHVLPTRAKGA